MSDMVRHIPSDREMECDCERGFMRTGVTSPEVQKKEGGKIGLSEWNSVSFFFISCGRFSLKISCVASEQAPYPQLIFFG